MSKSILLLLLLIASFVNYGEVLIKPNDQRITINGAMFLTKQDTLVAVNRFNPEFFANPATLANSQKANTQSGVSIVFQSNSSHFELDFKKREDGLVRQMKFGVFFNDQFYGEYSGLPLRFDNPDKKNGIWKVLFPSFSALDFCGVKIDDEASFQIPPVKKKPVYLAIGNSITHGVGQGGFSHITYPFVLAENKGWQLYNLGIGGSKISWPIAKMTSTIVADVITVLWGFNDWNAGMTLLEISSNYEKLITELLLYQPKAKIYCMLPTATRRTEPKKGMVKLEDIRNAQQAIVSRLKGKYSNLFVIDGSEHTALEDLNDDVHLSVQGAANFANNLIDVINL